MQNNHDKNTSLFKAGLAGLLIISLLAAGCGFKLRGAGQVLAWPGTLQKMQLRFDSTVDADFRALLRHQLVDRFKVEIVKQAAPELIISDLTRDRRVLSLNATGKVSEYLLRLHVGFELRSGDKNLVVEKQTVRLQRAFSYASTDILANEVEEARLSEQMQKDAVRRILRRVIFLSKSP